MPSQKKIIQLLENQKMARKKLKRFEESQSMNNIIEETKEIFTQIKGKWSTFFENDNPIVLELACGNGEYTLGLAKQFPNRNFIGVDLKGDRIWNGANYAQKNGLTNVAFLRGQILHLNQFFADNEVSEIWVVFPDPRPRGRDIRRRLTSPRFLKIYQDICKQEALIHLKTDNTKLFDYTLELLATDEHVNTIKNLNYTKDLYESDMFEEHFGITTRYEKIWTERGENIKYLRFEFQ